MSFYIPTRFYLLYIPTRFYLLSSIGEKRIGVLRIP